MNADNGIIDINRILLAAFALLASYFLFFWLYSFQYDWDTIHDALLFIKFENYSAGSLHPHSPLLAILINSLNCFSQPLISLILISCAGFTAIFFLLFKTLDRLVGPRLALLTTLIYFSTTGIYRVTLEMDDNFIQLPFVLGSFYVAWFFEKGRYAAAISGLLMSAAAAFHIQVIFYIPLLALIHYYKSNGDPMKSRNETFAIFVSCCLIFPSIIAALIFAGKYTGAVQEISAYIGNPEYSFLAKGVSARNIIENIFNLLIYAAYYLAPPFFFAGKLKINFLYLSAVWSSAIGVISLYSLKNIDAVHDKKIIVLTNFAAYFLTAVFAFFYEGFCDERWCTGTIFIYINFAMGLKIILENKRNSHFYPIPHALGRHFYSIAVFITIITIISTHFSTPFAATVFKKDWFCYPNISTMKKICDTVPPECPLLIGPDKPWLMLSYLRPGIVLYHNEFSRRTVKNGVFNNLDLDGLKKKYPIIYFHEDEMPFIKENFKNSDYTIEMFRKIEPDIPLNGFFGIDGSFNIFSITKK